MKTQTKSRLLVALAALILVPIFFVPVWTIGLVAPQYPDGMGMYIGVSEVWGHDEHDIQNINILNHYIGMQPIEPEAIPELDIFPPVLVGIIVLGLAAAAIGRRWALTGWLALFVGLAIAGLVDFYLWMIDYGHNLDPMAAIKVPGMTYTPPLIGSKELLNITASSWPHIGSFFLAASMALGAWAVFLAWRRPKATTASSTPLRMSAAAVVLVAALPLAACGGPEARQATPATEIVTPEGHMVYGESEDPYCGGLVERIRWGGEIETTQGERLRFRSVECLAAHLAEGRTPAAEVAAVRVVDFPHGTQLLPAEEAHFLLTPNLASPANRGHNVMAIGTEKLAVSLQEGYSGRLMAWDEVLELAAASGPSTLTAQR